MVGGTSPPLNLVREAEEEGNDVDHGLDRSQNYDFTGAADSSKVCGYRGYENGSCKNHEVKATAITAAGFNVIVIVIS